MGFQPMAALQCLTSLPHLLQCCDAATGKNARATIGILPMATLTSRIELPCHLQCRHSHTGKILRGACAPGCSVRPLRGQFEEPRISTLKHSNSRHGQSCQAKMSVHRPNVSFSIKIDTTGLRKRSSQARIRARRSGMDPSDRRGARSRCGRERCSVRTSRQTA